MIAIINLYRRKINVDSGVGAMKIRQNVGLVNAKVGETLIQSKRT